MRLALTLLLSAGLTVVARAQSTPPSVVSADEPQVKPLPPATTDFSVAAAAKVSAESLMASVRSLPLKRSGMGGEEHAKGLHEAELVLVARLKELGYSPQIHEFTWASPASMLGADKDKPPVKPTFHNVIVDIPGESLASEVLLVGAHFDAVAKGPGADDNATGTAAILELAKVYHGGKPARTIRLALLNLEEVGLVGSSAYAHDWVVKNRRAAEPGAPAPEKIVGMISLEMLGFYSDEPGSQKSPIPKIEGVFEPSTVGDSIAMVGIKANQGFSRELMRRMMAHAADLKVTAVDFMPVAIPDMMRSDHQPFLVAGAPAVMLTDTANFRNPNYHKATDTVDTLDPKRFTLTVKAIVGAVWSMADAK